MRNHDSNKLLEEIYNSLRTAMHDLWTAKDMNHCAEKKALVESIKQEVTWSKDMLDSFGRT